VLGKLLDLQLASKPSDYSVEGKGFTPGQRGPKKTLNGTGVMVGDET